MGVVLVISKGKDPGRRWLPPRWPCRGTIASLEAVKPVVTVAADLRLGMTGWPRGTRRCRLLWPVCGPDRDATLRVASPGQIGVLGWA